MPVGRRAAPVVVVGRKGWVGGCCVSGEDVDVDGGVVGVAGVAGRAAVELARRRKERRRWERGCIVGFGWRKSLMDFFDSELL